MPERGTTEVPLERRIIRKSNAPIALRLASDEAQSMSMYETQFRSAAVLFRSADILQAAARRVRAAAKWLYVWLEKRRLAAAAFDAFETMSERDLLDIGLSRADMNRVAWGASDRNSNPI